MRRFLVLTILLLLLATAGSASAARKTTFFINGHGWGHGIGMSQFGAQGLALHGRTWREIIRHYYPGTGRWRRPAGDTVQVILTSGVSTVRVGSQNAAFKVNGKRLPAGMYTAKLRDSGGIRLTKLSNGKRWTFGDPATLTRTTGWLRLGSTVYRGKLVLDVKDGSLRVINRVDLEEYLYGVVPPETIDGWKAHAYRAQAVAARSYALASGALSATTSSQVYGGKSAETPATTAAVDATAGRVVVYPADSHNVLQTFFFSTSGGRTCSYADCGWSGSPAYSYPSVKDPFDSISPLHDWGPIRYTSQRVRELLGSSAPKSLRDMTTSINSSSRVASVRLVGATTRSVSGGQFRDAFSAPSSISFEREVKSTWFRISVLRLSVSGDSVAPGTKVRIHGFARRMGSTLNIQQRPAGGAWQAAGKVGISNHHFEIVTRPNTTTAYRVRSGGKVSGTVVVKVAS
jgi:stage II sporulation protein D